MKFKLSLIALALASTSASVFAFDFGVKAANVTSFNSTTWKCTKCVSDKQVIGQVGIEAGAMSSDDDHAANNLRYTDGFAAGVDADVIINNQGYRTEIYSDGLGSEQSEASVKTGRLGMWSVQASYGGSHQYDADNAQSQWVAQDGDLIDQGALVTQPLIIERQKYKLEADYKRARFATYINYSSEDKSGNKAGSISNGGLNAINIAAPIDSTTQILNAGVSLVGSNWLTELNYNASWFENNIDSLVIEGAGFPAASQAVDNQAHFVTLLGQYTLDGTYITGRLSSGNMSQDSDFITMTGVPNGNSGANAEVDTLDANIKISSRFSKRLRVNASVDYSDRDNTTDIYEYEQYVYDDVTGELVENAPYDLTRTSYKVSANYHFAPGQRVEVGFDRIDTERSNQDRETTDDNVFWAQWRASNFDLWDIRVKASYADKGGSEFVYQDAVASSEDLLMRKYHLADKKSSKAELYITHTPTDSVALNLRSYYSIDDYTNTSVGLIESVNYGTDLGISWQVLPSLILNADGGYQWVDNQQGSAHNDYSSYWSADTNEEFGFVGVGFSYSGLSDYGVTLGGDYSFAISFSDSYMDGDDIFGLYESTSHNATLYADYLVSEKVTVGLRYEYEGYQDSDDNQLPVNYKPGHGPLGLTTLGELNHDYKAHLILATLQYRF